MNRRTYVVAFPVWADAASALVEPFRALHDPHSALLDAHFTLVFASPQSSGLLAREARSVADRLACVPFVTRRATRMQAGDGATLAVLVPDQGQSGIGALHDDLHRGALAPEWRLDLDFHPHLTIGRAATTAGAQTLCDRWNATAAVLRGQLDALSVVVLEGDRLHVDSVHRLRPT